MWMGPKKEKDKEYLEQTAHSISLAYGSVITSNFETPGKFQKASP